MVPGATDCKALVPLPTNTLLAVSVVVPVPPFATGKAPVTPEVNGSPVRFVATPEAGVPIFGAINVGEFDKTTFPVPVEFPVVISFVVVL
uniref:hypothetical protein n=1 Tax=Algoriphagus sp. TaxID=1872435 RepID=UPI004048EA06